MSTSGVTSYSLEIASSMAFFAASSSMLPPPVNATSTDAVNGSQLYSVQQQIVNNNSQGLADLRYQVGQVGADANAGTASAMAAAGLPQAYLPGKSMLAVSGSMYRGESAQAIGLSTVSDNGKWIFKGSVNRNSRGYVGATVGAGFQW